MPQGAHKLIERLSKQGRDLEEDVDVTFTFCHDDFEYLIPLAEKIGDFFAEKLDVEYDSVVIDYNEHPDGTEDDNDSPRKPNFTLSYIGPLTKEQFSMLDELAATMAKQNQITYDGVTWWCN